MIDVLRRYARPVLFAAALALALALAYVLAGPTLLGGPSVLPVGGASISLPDGVVLQEATIEASGEGFRPGERVSLRSDIDEGDLREFGSATADGEGRLARVPVPLPEWLVSGVHQVEAVGTASGRRGEARLRVRAKGPWVTINEPSVRQGSRLGLVAGGFEPGERVLATLLPREYRPEEGEVELGALEADEIGNTSWTELTLPLVPDREPSGPAGVGGQGDAPSVDRPDWWQQHLLLRGERSDLEAKYSITVQRLKPRVELSPWFGPPGAKVDVNAQGFLPGETVDVSYVVGTTRQPAISLAADEYGNLWGAGPVRVPYDTPGGDLLLELFGHQSQLPVESKFGVVDPKPWVELSSWSGYPGTGILFSGGGWAAEEQVVAHLGSAAGPAVAASITDGQGWLHGMGPTIVSYVPPTPTSPAPKPNSGAQTPGGSPRRDASAKVMYVLVGQRSRAQASVEFTVLIPFFERPSEPSPPQPLPPAAPQR